MGRREDNKADKRRRLEAAGLRAFLEDGYADASIERVVADAAVARGTFYLYFPDKPALFLALLDRFYDPLTDAVARARDALHAGADPPTTYLALGAELAALLLGYPDGARLALREARSPGAGGDAVRARDARVVALTRDILQDAVARGLLREHDAHAVALAITGGVERLVWAVLAEDAPLDPAAVTAELIGLFTDGLARR